MLAICACLALVAALAVAIASVASPQDLVRGLASAGIWVPLGVLGGAALLITGASRRGSNRRSTPRPLNPQRKRGG